jgi:hypothetical protein
MEKQLQIILTNVQEERKILQFTEFDEQDLQTRLTSENLNKLLNVFISSKGNAFTEIEQVRIVTREYTKFTIA